MGLKPLLSFSSGELDPILTDNVTLEKFNKGLSTARNVIIGKTGSIMSRFSRYHLANAKNSGEEIIVYCPPNSPENYVLEWGNLYVRIYTLSIDDYGTTPSLSLQVELAHTLTESDLPNLHFVTSKNYVYVFCAGRNMKKLELNYGLSSFVAEVDMFAVLDPLNTANVNAFGAPTGYKVDYLVTLVVNGEESLFVENTTGYNKPIAAGQSNVLTIGWTTADVNEEEVSEVRVYSRPHLGGAYGYLGSTNVIYTVGPNQAADYTDIGQLPDYANGVQDIITKYGLNGADIIDLQPKTGTVYQGRLIITSESDEEAIIASRPGFHNNFYRDFPYASNSALQFKAGTSGKAKVLRFVESDGLVVFTTNGVYTSTGLLTVDNIALDRRGGWIINEDLPPLVVPGGVFFVDKSNTIRQLVFSQEILAYESVEQTIFSNHLFTDRTIESWAFQDGVFPVIIVTFSDGTFATFTYNFEHQMKAWTRHDSIYPVEQVEGTGQPNRSYFVVNKDGDRSIEMTLPRRISAEVIVNNPEIDKYEHNILMDSIVSTKSLLNNLFPDPENHFMLTPVTVGEWDGELELTSDYGFDFSSYSIGDIFRFFNPDDGTTIDLEITNLNSSTLITVQPSEEFPVEYSQSARLYLTYNSVSGLDHLEGELVSVVVDGYLLCSPANDVERYSSLLVSGGSITLPDGLLGAIIHVGRPVIADVKTLNISTVEQSPTLIESLTVNKLYIRVNKTKGLYCGSKFPEEDEGEVDGSSVENMEDLFEGFVPVNDELIGNRPLPEISKRIAKTLPGTWGSQGQIALRQVDPYHFEILSIIPDVEILSRRDR